MGRAAGLSLVELSAARGAGQSYVSKAERGEMYVDVMAFVGWCLACKVPPEEAMARLT